MEAAQRSLDDLVGALQKGLRHGQSDLARDLLVFDTTAFSTESGRIQQFLNAAQEARTPVVLVRSHTKLDTLGIEYGRLGSTVFLTFPDVPLAKFAKWREVSRGTRDLVRLLGSAALPAHFCLFAAGRSYRELSSRRSAVMLRNGRFLVRTLMQKLGEATVRRYAHGMFAALVPPRVWREIEAAAEAEQVASALAGGGLPVRHAGSFGFDFVAIEGFFDTAADRQQLLRVALGDLPAPVCVRLADDIATWWEHVGGHEPLSAKRQSSIGRMTAPRPLRWNICRNRASREQFPMSRRRVG